MDFDFLGVQANQLEVPNFSIFNYSADSFVLSYT